MKVKCVDVLSPRSDGKFGRPSSLTVGKVYEVAEILDSQFSIINDSMKIGRYTKERFEVICNKSVPDLRANFNTLTTPLRTRIKELEKELEGRL